jgi:hypothetical protein
MDPRCLPIAGQSLERVTVDCRYCLCPTPCYLNRYCKRAVRVMAGLNKQGVRLLGDYLFLLAFSPCPEVKLAPGPKVKLAPCPNEKSPWIVY